MADPFFGEIRAFAFDFAPHGWAYCDGQTMPIVQNTALFSLLGTQYGGDGRTTFVLPDLRGRTPLGRGSVKGTEFKQGETRSFFSAETSSAPVDEQSYGTLGVNFCIALWGVFPSRA
jgi:microcystin-dependent protein